MEIWSVGKKGKREESGEKRLIVCADASANMIIGERSFLDTVPRVPCMCPGFSLSGRAICLESRLRIMDEAELD